MNVLWFKQVRPMKSITIHGLEEALHSRIREKAQQQGLSLNKTIKKLLSESLGVDQSPYASRRASFLDLFGCWPKEEAEMFRQNISELGSINPGDWE
jgi:hypothetical protein